MSEQDDETTRLAEQPPTSPTAPAAAPAPASPGWRERVYGIRSVAAVAVAGLIIGGGAGAAIHAATDDGRDGPGRMGFPRGPGGGFGGPGQMQGGPNGQLPQPPNGLPAPPNGVPGQTQPTTPPDDGDGDDGGNR